MRESDRRWLRDKDMTTEQRRERNMLATERAKKVLKPGDRLCVSRCGGSQPTVTFVEWDGLWIRSRTLDDIAASNILRLNGKPVDFTLENWSGE